VLPPSGGLSRLLDTGPYILSSLFPGLAITLRSLGFNMVVGAEPALAGRLGGITIGWGLHSACPGPRPWAFAAQNGQVERGDWHNLSHPAEGNRVCARGASRLEKSLRANPASCRAA
jgi:hypothetical protein